MPGTMGDLDGRDYAAVLFDMDGTLIDSIPVVVRSWARWAGEYEVDLERLGTFHGIPAAAIIAQLLPAEQHAAALARIVALEVADTDGITVLPGAAEALAALPPGRCAIATSCTSDLAAVRIAATGLAAPGVLVTASDLERGKPHPDPYLRAAELLGVDPSDCLVVEDAPGGLAAGRAAGCATLAVTTTTDADVLASDPNADHVIGTLAEVVFEVDAGSGRVRVRPS